MMRCLVLALAYMASAATGCMGPTGGAYKTSMSISGVTLEEVLETVKAAAPELHLRDDSTSQSESIFRSDIKGVECGFVLVQIATTATADKVIIWVEQSCGPRPNAPTELTEIFQALQRHLEARFGEGRILVEPAYFEPRA